MAPQNPKAIQARSIVDNCVNHTLFPFLFVRLDKDGLPTPLDFELRELPRTISIFCKFSGLLVQAYWLATKRDKKQGEIPSRLDGLLLQIWAGYQKYWEPVATSVLLEASLAPDGSWLAENVRSADVFRRCHDLLSLRHQRFRAFDSVTFDLYQLFTDVLTALPLLANTACVDEEFHLGGKSVPVFPLVYRSDQVSHPLFLYRFEQEKSKSQVIFEDPRSSYYEELSFRQYPALREPYALIRRFLEIEDVSEGIVFLFGGGYEHIQNLAYAITFAQGPGCQNRIEELLKRRRTHVWHESMNKGRKPTKQPRREDLVTFLLAADGPLETMAFLLEGYQDLYHSYLAYLATERKLGTVESWEGELQETIAAKERAIKLLIDEQEQDRSYCAAHLNAKCSIVLRAAGFPVLQQEEHVESIDKNIDSLNKLKDGFLQGKYTSETACLRAARNLERVFRFLICFYSGLQVLNRAINKWRDDTQIHEQKMLQAVRSTFNRVKEFTPGQLFGEFGNLLSQCQEFSESLLERSCVCNVRRFNQLTGAPWLRVLNRVKHETVAEDQVTSEEVLAFLEGAIELLQFLRDGSTDAIDLPSLEPVYPLVISFREAHRKRDGFLIYTYQIYSVGERQGAEVNILTPREYIPNEQYYCIPLYNRSTQHWWLDPLLIRRRTLDRTLAEGDDSPPISNP